MRDRECVPGVVQTVEERQLGGSEGMDTCNGSIVVSNAIITDHTSTHKERFSQLKD